MNLRAILQEVLKKIIQPMICIRELHFWRWVKMLNVVVHNGLEYSNNKQLEQRVSFHSSAYNELRWKYGGELVVENITYINLYQYIYIYIYIKLKCLLKVYIALTAIQFSQVDINYL